MNILQFPAAAAACKSSERLTPREAEVVSLAHLSNSEIARLLGISVATVKTLLVRAFDKLGVQNRTAAALVAQERRAA